MLGTKEVHLLAQEAGGGYRLPRQSDPDTVQNGSVFQVQLSFFIVNVYTKHIIATIAEYSKTCQEVLIVQLKYSRQ